MNGLLIGVLVFLALLAVYGAVRGLAKMVLSVAAVVLAGLLVWITAPYVRTEVTAKTDIEEKLAEKVTDKLHELIESDVDLEERVKNLPLTDKVKELVTDTRNSFDRKITELGTSIANLIFSAGIYLLLFLVFYIFLRIIAYLIERLADSKGLKFWNRLAGIFLALLEGVLILNVAAIILIFFAGTEGGMKAYELIYSDRILTWINDNNLLLLMINRHTAG